MDETHDFEALVRRHQGVVCAVAYSLLRNRARSEEVAQDAFLIAWQKLPTLASPPAMPAWLCGIARNLAANAARRKDTAMATTDTTALADRETPLDTLLDREASELAHRALAELAAPDREVVTLYYRNEESIADVASALGITAAAARQRLHRGRERLKSALAAVETTLRQTRPTPAFTAACVAGLAAGTAAKASAATAAAVAAKSSATAAPVATSSAVPVAAKSAAAPAVAAKSSASVAARSSAPVAAKSAVAAKLSASVAAVAAKSSPAVAAKSVAPMWLGALGVAGIAVVGIGAAKALATDVAASSAPVAASVAPATSLVRRIDATARATRHERIVRAQTTSATTATKSAPHTNDHYVVDAPWDHAEADKVFDFAGDVLDNHKQNPPVQYPDVLNKASLRHAIRDIQPLLLECYTAAALQHPHEHGTIGIILRLVGDTEGTLVDRVKVDGDVPLAHDAELGECMRETAMTIELPPMRAPGTWDVHYPFTVD